MYQYRHILVRMRLGESDRQIDAAGLMGRRTVAKLRKKALKFGWLEPEQSLAIGAGFVQGAATAQVCQGARTIDPGTLSQGHQEMGW